MANGVVYVGSGDGNVYALNAKTGALLWSYNTGDVCSSPAVANGVVYVGSERRQRVRAECQNRRQAVELPHRQLCGFLARRGEWGGLCRLVDGNVYALNASTGALLWSYTTGGTVDSSPAVANGVVYIGSEEATCTR